MARPKKPAEMPIIPPWFKIWTSWNDSISMLTNEQAGELLKAMVTFSIDGTIQPFKDGILKACWSFMVHQLQLDRQKYINQVKSNREAGRISAKVKAEKTQKKLYQKSGVSKAGNTDGIKDSKQVLTTVNEERREKEEEPKEKKRIEVTDSLDKASTTDFDVDGYNMANNLWFKYNGRQSLSLQEKSYLRKCVAQHGAEFVCGCIGILKNQKKIISTTTLPAVITEQKAKAEAEAIKQELVRRSKEALEKAKAEIGQLFVDAGQRKDHFDMFFRRDGDFGVQVMTLIQDDNFANNGIYHVELVKEIIQELKKNNNPTNIHWVLNELKSRKGIS